MGKIGQAFTADNRTVLLIDEIDKADTDFQDDMLDILDQMEFDIIEIDKTIRAKTAPGLHHYLQRQKRFVGSRFWDGAIFTTSPFRIHEHDEKDHPCPFSRISMPDLIAQNAIIDLLPASGDRCHRKTACDPRIDQLDPGAQRRTRISSSRRFESPVKSRILGMLVQERAMDYERTRAVMSLNGSQIELTG